ncbi:hypothetical protein Syun_023097 [Stephania yunnanensis]|uniref:Uncharacterized protein n=1 Tax=Stephania yunnanensis TaxID=152371 RepID=A0AAP0I363_9MAGN
MARLDINVLPEKTISHEVIKRYGKVNDNEDTEDEIERAEIARRENEHRRKIKYDTRRIVEEMSEARNDPNVEQPARDYDRIYMEESYNLDVPTLLRQEYHLYDLVVSHQSKRIDPVEDDEDVTSGR